MKQQRNKDFNLEDFQFIGSHLLVKAVKIEETKDGLIKPKTGDDKPEFGVVLSVGEEAGTRIKKGDTILFGRYVSEQTESNGEIYYFVRQEDVKGVLQK